MSKLKVKEHNEWLYAQKGCGPTHSQVIDMMRAYGNKTWLKPRHDKKTYTKFNSGRKLTKREADLIGEELDYLMAKHYGFCR